MDPQVDDAASIAVVGMAGRFPGAADLEQFWDNLASGVESITRWPVADGSAGMPAAGVLEGADEFDAELFGCSPNEALTLDPQQRLFLECAWEALDDSGHDPAAFSGEIGTFGGSSETAYAGAVRAYRSRLGAGDAWQRLRLGTGLDFLTTRVAYKLGLRGPAVTVQTACSTSLVAVHVAAQSLLAGECDLALAGGVTVHLWADAELSVDDGYLSTDGRCRAFDAGARGTVFGNGVGVVALRRLGDALEDGDAIRAVLRGSAVNNDGRDKIGFTAPSVEGQAQVVRAAHLTAGVAPETISYVEAHGTGTAVGDPIEIAALTRAFRRGTDRTGFCRIGSVKTNIGHTDAAAGVAGLTKTVLALEHRWLPASLNFVEPNPRIDFAGSPFVVNDAGRDWPAAGSQPRRAGVSSLGIGGTNAHVVVEQAPDAPVPAAGRSPQLVVLSARTETAVEAATARLADHLRRHPELELADVAWTLQVGRRVLGCRRFAVCRDRADAVRALDREDPGRLETATGDGRRREVVFVFPGQGGQHLGMGRELYEQEPEFRDRIDECCMIAAPLLGLDLRELLFPPAGDAAAAAASRHRLERLDAGQPAVFAVELALARLWLRWAVTPAAVAGHSLGAYAAACIAGVLTLTDAMRLVVARGRLLDTLPPGSMLAVPLPEEELAPQLTDGVSVAVVNGPNQTVVAGPPAAVCALRDRLAETGVDARLLRIPAAGHCSSVEPVVAEFRRQLDAVPLRPPTLPFLSDTTGEWAGADELTRAAYWARHLRQPVRFGDVLVRLLQDPDRVLLEVGPGRALTSLARQHPARTAPTLAVASLPHPAEDSSERAAVLTAAGRLWLSGVPLSWRHVGEGERRRRVRLPAYPFERKCYTLPPPPAGPAAAPEVAASEEPHPDATSPGPPSPPGGSAGPVPPALSGTERQLLDAFTAVLGGDIGVHDNFFDLGGDSVTASDLVRRIRLGSGRQVQLPQVFRAPTVRLLAALLDGQAGADGQADPDGRGA